MSRLSSLTRRKVISPSSSRRSPLGGRSCTSLIDSSLNFRVRRRQVTLDREVDLKSNTVLRPRVLGTTKHLEKHAFLRGNFAPVSEEHVALPVEIVEGELPLGLDGAFLRNGPNPIRSMQRKRYHWFDGHAMLHTLMIKDGKATYTNQVRGHRGIRPTLNADTFPARNLPVHTFSTLQY